MAVGEDHTETAATSKLAAGPPRSSPERDELLDQLVDGRYRIERQIAVGGMGVVYAGHDIELGRAVAIKVVASRIQSPAAQDRLFREARAMARLRHPNVVAVYDLGRLTDRLFIVMELVEGGTLEDWLSAATRSWRDVVAVFLQAARGLIAAHDVGVVHRDFKPLNVLVGEDGIVRVTDFGVVRLVGDVRPVAEAGVDALGATETRGGTTVGTPGYIAPEILRGETVDARADQFSFCVALHYALYGRRPFDSTDEAARERETLGELRTDRQRRGPRWLHRIVRRGLASDPDGRWPTLGLLVAAIERQLQRGRRLRVIAAVVAGLTAVAAAAIATRQRLPARPRQISEVSQHQVTFDGHAKSLGLSPDGKTLAFLTRNRLRMIDLEHHKEYGARPDRLFDQYVFSRWRSDSNSLELLVRPDLAGEQGNTAIRMDRDTGAVTPIPAFFKSAYSPDDQLVAGAPLAAKSVRIEAQGKDLVPLAVPGDYEFLFVYEWSPDGEWLLVGTLKGATLSVWNVRRNGTDVVPLFSQNGLIELQTAHYARSREGVLYLRPHTADQYDLVFLPLEGGRPKGQGEVVLSGIPAVELSLDRNGRTLAYTRERGASELWIFSVDGSEPPYTGVRGRRLLGDAASKQAVAISPLGSQIAYVARDGPSQSLFIESIDGGLPQRLPAPGGTKCSLAWSPDGTEVALVVIGADGAYSTWIVPVSGGAARPVDFQPFGCEIHWSPDGGLVLHSSGNRSYLRVDPAAGGLRTLVGDDTGWVFSPAWAPDGRHFALYWNHPDDAYLWVVSADGRDKRRLSPGLFAPVEWSFDQQWIYVVKPMGTLESWKIWETLYRIPASGGDAQAWLRLPTNEQSLAEVSISTDGSRIAAILGGESDVWIIEDFDQLLPR